jgi:hypothetical protein
MVGAERQTVAPRRSDEGDELPFQIDDRLARQQPLGRQPGNERLGWSRRDDQPDGRPCRAGAHANHRLAGPARRRRELEDTDRRRQRGLQEGHAVDGIERRQ